VLLALPAYKEQLALLEQLVILEQQALLVLLDFKEPLVLLQL
jgi:hypothetical protein